MNIHNSCPIKLTITYTNCVCQWVRAIGPKKYLMLGGDKNQYRIRIHLYLSGISASIALAKQEGLSRWWFHSQRLLVRTNYWFFMKRFFFCKIYFFANTLWVKLNLSNTYKINKYWNNRCQGWKELSKNMMEFTNKSNTVSILA